MPSVNDSSVYVGVELGGTKMVVAASQDGLTVSRREQVPTTDPDTTLRSLRDAIREVAGEERIEAVGLASFGPIDLRAESDSFGQMLATPKPGWTGVDIVEGITGGLDVPVGVDTDVNGAVLAEALHGAGSDYRHVAYLTVGTGVGGGIWTDGGVLHGANHPEVGHIRVPRQREDHHTSSCPFHDDCLEGMASGTAVRERWGTAAQDLGHLTPAATKLEAWYLARGIAGLSAVVPVEVVIIGGGLSHLPDLHAQVAAALDEASGRYPPVPFAEGGPTIVPPGLGSDSGVLGAIELAKAAKRG
ncbi:MAG: ROK family protein [Actinomycetota bacterium]